MKAFFDFLISNFVLIVLIVVFVNYINGMAKAWKRNDFRIARALQGLKDIILLIVGLLTLGALFFAIKTVQIYGLPFAEATFKLITTLVIAYYGNSVITSGIYLLKIPTPAFLKTIDSKVKELFDRSNPVEAFGADNVEKEADESEVKG